MRLQSSIAPAQISHEAFLGTRRGSGADAHHCGSGISTSGETGGATAAASSRAILVGARMTLEVDGIRCRSLFASQR